MDFAVYWIGAQEKTNIDVGRSTDALSQYAKIDREKFFKQTFSTMNLWNNANYFIDWIVFRKLQVLSQGKLHDIWISEITQIISLTESVCKNHFSSQLIKLWKISIISQTESIRKKFEIFKQAIGALKIERSSQIINCKVQVF